MDVTLSNFNQVLPEVLSAVDESDFIVIDTELTGLRNGPEITAYDTPSIYYTKLKAGSLDFLLIQIGLCTFRFDHQKNKYVYKAFNFYVFPRTFGHNHNETNFLCQSSSINFLCNNGFDFNKLFKEGIPYLNIADAENLKDEINAKYENLNKSELVFTKIKIPDEFSAKVEEICSRIEKFLSPENDEKEIVFDRCGQFLRKLIYQTANERFPSKNYCLSTKRIGNNMVLVAQKGKSKADVDKENFEREKKELAEATGFSKIIKHISDSKKLIIGHNMVLDICHIVNRFCWPLPDTYSEFKQMVHALFPRILDTKYMCHAYPFRDFIQSSVVEHMLKRLHEPPFEFKEAEAENPDFSYSMESDKAHQAGYDAYVTGLAFISLTTYLGKKSNQSSEPPSIEMLKPFENRVNVMKIVDYNYINFKGEEPIPSRNHIFHLSFPKDWKTSNIMEIFKPYGEIHVSYINQNSAWISLHETEKAQAVIADLVEANLKGIPVFRKPYTVITLHQYYEREESTSPDTPNSPFSATKRSSRLCSSPFAKVTASANSSSSVSQPSGDADPVKEEVKLPAKRSCTTETVSTKRKKKVSFQNDLNSDVKGVNENNDSSVVDTTRNPSKRTQGSIGSSVAQLRGGEDSVQKTFEEPPWE